MNKHKKKRILNALNKQVVGCIYEQPYEGDYMWLGPHTELCELVDFDVSDDEWKEILLDYTCPICGVSFDNQYAEVEYKSQYDYDIEDLFLKLKDRRRIRSLSHFNKFLSSFPYLGYKTSLGRKLFKIIASSKFISINNEIWFRGRPHTKGTDMFVSTQMHAPSANESTPGRYNHGGHPLLYLSRHETTILDELFRDDYTCDIVIQQFKIKHIDRILDLRNHYDNIKPNDNLVYLALIYNGYLYKQKQRGTSNFVPEYYIPRYVSDIARSLNFNGIIYTSVYDNYGFSNYSDNLVLFSTSFDKCDFDGEPYLFNLTDYANKTGNSDSGRIIDL